MTALTYVALVLSVVSLAVALVTLVAVNRYANQMTALLTRRTPVEPRSGVPRPTQPPGDEPQPHEPRRVRRWFRTTREGEITT